MPAFNIIRGSPWPDEVELDSEVEDNSRDARNVRSVEKCLVSLLFPHKVLGAIEL